jgi:hypothetical protein
MSGADLSFVNEVNRQLSAHQFVAESFALTSTGRDLIVRLLGKPDFYIRFLLEEEAAGQAGRAIAVMKKLSAENKKAAEYIDVRVDERAYYR